MAYPFYTGSTPTTTTSGVATKPGEFDWIAQLISGAGNLATASGDLTTANRAAGMADPWGPNRGQYADLLNQYMQSNQVNPAASTARSSNAYDMLQGLLANPESLTKMPGYQYGLNQAMEGVNRGAGASGLLNSGNRLMALQDRGEGYARDWQKQMYQELLGNVGAANNTDALGLNAQGQGFNQLGRLSGLDQSNPGLAAQMFLHGRENQTGSIGAGIGGIANGIGGALPLIQRWLSGGVNNNGSINWGDFTGQGNQGGFPGGFEDMWNPDAGNVLGDISSGGDWPFPY